MECFCYWRNAHDKMTDVETAFEKRHDQKFNGPSMPFGRLVEYIPITAKDKSRVQQFGGWSGDLMIADCEDLHESEACAIYVNRLKSQANGTLRFPNRPRPSLLAEGSLEPEDGVEIEEGDEKGRNTEYSWSVTGEFILSTS